LVFARRRIALFVHGCFWHGHHCARGARAPKTNAAYWSAKIARNRARDAGVEAHLRALAWTPLTVWECELKQPAAVLARLQATIGSARAGSASACASAASSAA
jgi:DNA mismatch endonuclease (patch repair protein)